MHVYTQVKAFFLSLDNMAEIVQRHPVHFLFMICLSVSILPRFFLIVYSFCLFLLDRIEFRLRASASRRSCDLNLIESIVIDEEGL